MFYVQPFFLAHAYLGDVDGSGTTWIAFMDAYGKK